jgi:hypothetical protein
MECLTWSPGLVNPVDRVACLVVIQSVIRRIFVCHRRPHASPEISLVWVRPPLDQTFAELDLGRLPPRPRGKGDEIRIRRRRNDCPAGRSLFSSPNPSGRHVLPTIGSGAEGGNKTENELRLARLHAAPARPIETPIRTRRRPTRARVPPWSAGHVVEPDRLLEQA